MCNRVTSHNFLCSSINRRQFIATSIFPWFGRKGFPAHHRIDRRERFKEDPKLPNKHIFVHEKFMGNFSPSLLHNFSSFVSSLKSAHLEPSWRNARRMRKQKKGSHVEQKSWFLLRTTSGWVPRLTQKITGNVPRFSCERIIEWISYQGESWVSILKDFLTRFNETDHGTCSSKFFKETQYFVLAFAKIRFITNILIQSKTKTRAFENRRNIRIVCYGWK